MLRSFFPDRRCFTFVVPASDENILQTLDAQPLEKLRPKFVQQVIGY